VNDPLRAQQMVRKQVKRRRRWRRLRVTALVVVATTAVVAAAFGIDRLAVVVHKFYDEHHHSHPRASATTVASTTTTTVAGPPRCGSPQLSAEVSDWRESYGTVVEKVSVTNISATSCSLSGYPGLGAVAAGGTPLPATNVDTATIALPTSYPVATTAPATTVPVTKAPGTTTTPSVPVTLAHDARASFELAFSNICHQILEPGQAATGASGECYAGEWLEVTPSGGTSALLVTQPVRLTYATSGFQVSPFVAGDGLPLAGQPPLSNQPTAPSSPVVTSPPTTVPATTSPPTTGPPTSSP
jgi:hypothetical protein